MALDLRGSRAKIERAKEHISEFDRARVAFLETNPYVVITKFNPESNVTESIMGALPAIPDRLSAIAGDAIQNLRSALDYVAAELAIKVGNDPRFVYFPISESPEKYISESKGKTKGISKEAKEFIDSIEPYLGGNGSDLWFLHTLNNADKHRLLVTTTVNISPQVQFALSPEGNRFTTMVDSPGLNEGDILGSVSGNSEGKQRIQFTFDIAFGQPDPIAGDPILKTLEYMAHMVETIIGMFEAEF